MKKKKKKNRAKVFAEGKRRNSLQSKRSGIGEQRERHMASARLPPDFQLMSLFVNEGACQHILARDLCKSAAAAVQATVIL
jgi:hypothetical protein